MGANTLVGVGPGLVSFRQSYAQHQMPDTPAYHADNIFLQVWAERGILGLLLLVATFLLIGVAAVRGKAPRPERVLGLTTLAGAAGALVQGMVDYIWSDFRVALLFWALIGVGLGLCRSESAPKRTEP